MPSRAVAGRPQPHECSDCRKREEGSYDEDNAWVHCAGSGFESRHKLGGEERARTGGPSEHGETSASDKVVGAIPQRARNGGEQYGDGFPGPAEPPQNVNTGVRPGEQYAVAGLQHQAIGEASALAGRNLGQEGPAMYSRKVEPLS